MEFDEMKKIWDAQHSETLYAINEDALHKRIRSKKNRASRIASVNEIGLIIINIVVGSFLLYDATVNNESLLSFLGPIAFFIVAVYIYVNRIKRIKRTRMYGQTMMNDLEHAIANATYQVAFARTFVWWYLTPIFITTFVNAFQNGLGLGMWAVVIGAFILSYSLVNWELNKCHVPRRKELEALRDKLSNESD